MNANLLNKVVVIPGDIVLPGLGISNDNIELLSQEVSIVFHSAATVKFDEPMRFVNYSKKKQFNNFFQPHHHSELLSISMHWVRDTCWNFVVK